MIIKTKKTVYECPIFKIEERQVLRPSKKTFWVMVRPPHVGIAALTDDKKIVLIKEILKGKECLLLPGGKVEKYDASEREIRHQALAELQEETGFQAKNIRLLSKESSAWNTLDRDFYKFIAWDLQDIGPALEEGEIISRYLVSVEEAEQIIKERKMTSPEEERFLEKALAYFKERGLV